MPHRYPNQKRRRPTRPRRRPKRPPRSHGFTGAGWGAYYDLLLPGLQGREKREFFNQISLWLMAGCGLGGAVVGFDVFGVLGALIGSVVGAMIGANVCVKQRFYRS